MSYELGSTTYVESPIISAWRSAVIARRNTPVRMPSGPSTGELSERYTDRYGSYRYALAPYNVIQADRAERIADMASRGAGTAAELATKVLSVPAAVTTGILGAPRTVVAGVLGVPKPVVTVAAFLIGAVFLPRIVDAVFPPRRT